MTPKLPTVVKRIAELRLEITRLQSHGTKTAFVPTMGYLHAAHLSLVEIAKKHAPYTIVSIFVNPTQFNDSKDYERYPIDLERDLELLSHAQVDLVFIPEKDEIYGTNFQSWVEVGALTNKLDGVFRPGHFKGVTTVVSILFNAVQPDLAVFGEKDFQQLRTIEQMVKDLRINTQILRGPTWREPDGLALSSRNVRLNAPARKIAPEISRALSIGQTTFKRGERNAAKICEAARQQLKKHPDLQVEYLELVDEENLDSLSIVNKPARLLTAVWLDGVRLIDNVPLSI